MRYKRLTVTIIIAVMLLASLIYTQPIIADHNAVQEFDLIPANWLEQAKRLTVHYTHTSHGSQILSGLIVLQKLDSIKYRFKIEDHGNSQTGMCPSSPSVRTPIEIADGGDNTLRITREGAWPCGYWSTAEIANSTKEVLNYAGGLFDVSGWAWCGQVGSCPSSYLNCTDDQYIYDYLNQMEDYENSFPNMTFFYQTGHVNGCAPGECPSYNRIHQRNEIIRDFCSNNNKVLFDFADIESWDLNGNYHPAEDGSCIWCETWCNDPANADDLECQNRDLLPPNSDECCGGAGCGNMRGCERFCAHSHGINCVIKAKAWWWMMARIAGWEGAATDISVKNNKGSLEGDLQVHPNPYTKSIDIRVLNAQIPESTNPQIRLGIYDIHGRCAGALRKNHTYGDRHNASAQFGKLEISGIANYTWHAQNQPAGLYFVRFRTGNRTLAKTIILEK